MEIQLQELIDQIKKNGVEVAEGEAEQILGNAKAEAEKIIADAKAEADRIMQSARSENERLVRVSEEAIRQAGRNLLISFRESVSRELEVILGDKVTALYSSDSFASLLASVIESWTEKSDAEDISVILNESDLVRLEESLLAAMKEKLLGGVTLKPNDSFDGGFRIAVNGGRAYYDYSKEAVVDMLSAYLSPKVTALLKEAEGA